MIQIIMLYEQEQTGTNSIKNERSSLFTKRLQNILKIDILGIVEFENEADPSPLEEAINQNIPFIIDNTPMDIEQNTFTLINVCTGEKNNMSESKIIDLFS